MENGADTETGARIRKQVLKWRYGYKKVQIELVFYFKSISGASDTNRKPEVPVTNRKQILKWRYRYKNFRIRLVFDFKSISVASDTNRKPEGPVSNWKLVLKRRYRYINFQIGLVFDFKSILNRETLFFPIKIGSSETDLPIKEDDNRQKPFTNCHTVDIPLCCQITLYKHKGKLTVLIYTV